MKRISLFLFVAVTVCFCVEARLLSADEAKQKIMVFVEEQMPERMPAITNANNLQLAHTITDNKENNLIYIFNKKYSEYYTILESRIDDVGISDDEIRFKMTSDNKGFILKSNSGIKSVSIYSVSGNELIRQSEINQESIHIDISNFQRGIYIVKAESNVSKKTMKIIVK